MPDRKDIRRAMREAAEGATQEPWYVTGLPWFRDASGVLAGSPDPHAGCLVADCESFTGERDEYEGPLSLASAEADALHIATSCPANVIAAFDAYEEEIAELKRRLGE